ncbi:MAG: hypothetical protein R2695_04150 [Acidimicrobiales bacterium]
MLAAFFPGWDFTNWEDMDVDLLQHFRALLRLTPQRPGATFAGLVEPSALS